MFNIFIVPVAYKLRYSFINFPMMPFNYIINFLDIINNCVKHENRLVPVRSDFLAQVKMAESLVRYARIICLQQELIHLLNEI